MVAEVRIYLTVNRDASGRPVELFCKASDGWQGWLDTLMETVSVALQYGAPLEVILGHWRHHRFAPCGVPGQGSSIPDAIARRLFEDGDNKKVGS